MSWLLLPFLTFTHLLPALSCPPPFLFPHPAVLMLLTNPITRYSLFIVLYPPGIMSELGLAFHALPIMKVHTLEWTDVCSGMKIVFKFRMCYWSLSCYEDDQGFHSVIFAQQRTSQALVFL